MKRRHERDTLFFSGADVCCCWRSGGVWDAYIRITGVKELFEAIRNEVTILLPLRQQSYGDWEFEVKDPNGYVLVFSELMK